MRGKQKFETKAFEKDLSPLVVEVLYDVENKFPPNLELEVSTFKDVITFGKGP